MRLMTVKQYSEHINVSASTIRQMCADGILPATKIGRGYRIDMHQADEYFRLKIENRKVKKVEPKRAKTKVKNADFLAKLDEIKRNLKESLKNYKAPADGGNGAALAG